MYFDQSTVKRHIKKLSMGDNLGKMLTA